MKDLFAENVRGHFYLDTVNHILKRHSTSMQQNLDQMKKGLKFERFNTKEGMSPYDQFKYEHRTSVIKNPNGDVVFEMKNVEVPAA